MLSDDTKNFINTKAYKEIEADLIYQAENLFRLGVKDENLPFTEGLMKEYSIKLAKEYFIQALKNIHNSAKGEEVKKISWK